MLKEDNKVNAIVQILLVNNEFTYPQIELGTVIETTDQ